MTTEQTKKLEELARPMIEFLNDEFHPHVQVIIEPGGVKLTQDITFIPITDYIKD